MRVGVVCPFKNQWRLTELFINSIKNQLVPLDTSIVVYLIDNASDSSTKNNLDLYLKKDTPPNIIIKVLTQEENLGFPKGCNVGAVAALSDMVDIIIIANNDLELSSGAIKGFIDAFSNDEDITIGIVGSKLLFPDGRIQHAGAFLGLFGWGVHFGGGDPQDGPAYSVPREVEYVCGALFGIRPAVFSSIGLFDGDYGLGYFEEVDFQQRARDKGWKIIYYPDITAIHYEGQTAVDVFGGQIPRKQQSDFNQKIYYKKRWSIPFTPSDNPLKVLLSSKIYGPWSFTTVMRNLAKGLSRNGVDVSIAPVEYHEPMDEPDWEIQQAIKYKPNDYWNRICIRSSEGDHAYLNPGGKYRIHHTTGESTVLPPSWAEQLNHVDQVWTNSTFFKNILIDNKITTPIEIVPNSIDTSIFNMDVPVATINGQRRGFNFVSTFSFGDRKAPETLLRAFIQEFRDRDDVTLTVHSLSMLNILQRMKLTWDDFLMKLGQDIPNWSTLVQTRAPIFVINHYLSPLIMGSFYKAFDCFVLPTRAEGFSMSPLEAGAVGVPSITTNYSGHLDFLNKDNAFLLDYRLIDIPLQYLPYWQNYLLGQWADPSIEHLRHLMRYASNHKEECVVKGKSVAEVAKNYSLEVVGSTARSILEQI